MSTTTLTSKGQITLTKAIRERMGLKQGDRFQLAVNRDGALTLKREQAPTIEAAYGLLHRLAGRKPPSIAAMHAAFRARATRKHSMERP